ncbi:MAG: T9SS type B sorting domain-containing protein [Flavobacteriaceae bacterium]|nr:T9SS type B sorting domain-containing protein [Flavobacteriaceae bacterium]
MKKLFCILLICGYLGVSYAQITVDDNTRSAQQLVEDVLMRSDCVETSNWSMKSGDVGSGNIGVGYFNANGSDFPFKEGVIISTGKAKSAPGPNNSQLSDGNDDGSWGSDTDLINILPDPPADDLYNASYLEFDFVPKSPRITFNFFMASEEYSGNYPCTFSDVFAFILTDKDGNTKNLAVVPNTAIPIQVTSIHKAVEGETGCDAENEEYYAGDNPVDAPINFNGQTVVFTAMSDVVPNEPYHIKMVIADFKDGKWDSAVFLEAGSFNTAVDLGEARSLEGENPLCFDTQLDATTDGALDYKWFQNDVLLSAWQGQSIITVNSAQANSGTYKVVVDMGAGCEFEDEIQLDFVDPAVIQNPPQTVYGCDLDKDGVEQVDLEANQRGMLGSLDSNIYRFSYHKSQQDADKNTNAIQNSNAYTSSGERIFVRMEASEDCFETASFMIEVVDPGAIKDLPQDITMCVNGMSTGVAPLVLDIEMDPTTYDFQWYLGNDLADATPIPGATAEKLSVNAGGEYGVEITHKVYGCSYFRTTEIAAIPPILGIDVKVISKRFVEPNKIEVTVNGSSTYRYQLDDGAFQESNIFENVSPGAHLIKVEDIFGCHGIEKNITIVDFPKFFSPNGDGINDHWDLLGSESLTNYHIYIFDRYGKLLKKVSKGDPKGWDGTFEQIQLPEDDYWFRMLYLNDFGATEQFHGNFSLKR